MRSHMPTWSSRLERSSADGLTKLPLIVNMLLNTVTNISPNIVVDMYPDYGCCVFNSALNMFIGNKSPVLDASRQVIW